MSDVALVAVLRRDRGIVIAALATITAAAWAYTLWLAHGMDMGGAGGAMSMPDMPGMDMMAPAFRPWMPAEFAFVFVMWAVMMVGMMTPSAAPMILIYARVGRQAAVQGRSLPSVGWFAAGYLLAWLAFSIVATIGQWGLARAALLTPMMASASGVFGGIVLLAAGLYQWTPLKDVCLKHCQSPLTFIQRHGGFRRDIAGALRLGFRHGLYCVGCCWALMALLFVGGVMNVLWIAGLAIFVLAEKIAPVGRLLSRAAGLGLIGWGIWTLAAALR
jgi:predicted metal-binding membrane protein